MKHKLKNLTAKAQREIAKGAKTANTMIFFAPLVFFLRGLVGLRPCGKKLGGVRGGLSSPRRCHWAEITRTFGALRDFFYSCFRAFVPSCAFALSAFCLLLSSSLPAQTISNIKLSYSCPCKVTVIYNLDAAKPTDVQLFYSSDTVAYGWLLATTFPQKTAGTNTDYWDCSESGATYGQFFFKLEVVIEPSCCQPSTIDLAMIAVEGGIFILGAEVQNSTEGNSGAAITNAHQVTLSNFCISETPVTQAQFEAVMGINPSNFKGYADSPDRPVEMVNWYHAIAFCNRLSWDEGKTSVYSVKVGGVEVDWATIVYDDVPLVSNSNWNAATMDMSANGYRLPTEAEWEYAARGGQESETVQNGTLDFYYSGGNTADVVAWHWGNSGSQTHIVKDKAPNKLGLYDMSGNVWEWCWDRYGNYTATPKIDPTGATSGSYRVIRGGSWYSNANGARVSHRDGSLPGNRYYGIGFRIACSSE